MLGIVKWVLIITLVNQDGVSAPPTAIEVRSLQACQHLASEYKNDLPDQKNGRVIIKCYKAD